MNRRALVAIALGMGLVVATTSSPGGERYFTQSSPPNPQLIRALGRSHISLLADLFWIRAIGLSTRLKVPAEGLSLISWCQLVTELDPTFVWPYIFGGLLGPVPGATSWFNVKQANVLLQRGIEQIPGDFRLPLYLSYNQLHLQHDVPAAARTLRQAAMNSLAPVYFGQLATRLLTQANDFEAARAFASELEARSADPELREFFQRRRREIDRDRIIADLQRAADSFRGDRGRPPRSIAELRAEGLIAEVPADPAGGEFQIDAAGVVSSTSGSRLKAYFQIGDP